MKPLSLRRSLTVVAILTLLASGTPAGAFEAPSDIMRRLRSAPGAVPALPMPGPLAAPEPRTGGAAVFKADPARSRVTLTGRLGPMAVGARFTRFDIAVRLDPADPAGLQVAATVWSASAVSLLPGVVDAVRKALDADRHPTVGLRTLSTRRNGGASSFRSRVRTTIKGAAIEGDVDWTLVPLDGGKLRLRGGFEIRGPGGQPALIRFDCLLRRAAD
ncbi:MAG: YceI family protein [Elusimicrobia bacterium]|nr:YceI family protein [Elusimicrobiota bacterium]